MDNYRNNKKFTLMTFKIISNYYSELFIFGQKYDLEIWKQYLQESKPLYDLCTFSICLRISLSIFMPVSRQ